MNIQSLHERGFAGAWNISVVFVGRERPAMPTQTITVGVMVEEEGLQSADK